MIFKYRFPLKTRFVKYKVCKANYSWASLWWSVWQDFGICNSRSIQYWVEKTISDKKDASKNLTGTLDRPRTLQTKIDKPRICLKCATLTHNLSSHWKATFGIFKKHLKWIYSREIITPRKYLCIIYIFRSTVDYSSTYNYAFHFVDSRKSSAVRLFLQKLYRAYVN